MEMIMSDRKGTVNINVEHQVIDPEMEQGMHLVVKRTFILETKEGIYQVEDQGNHPREMAMEVMEDLLSGLESLIWLHFSCRKNSLGFPMQVNPFEL